MNVELIPPTTEKERDQFLAEMRARWNGHRAELMAEGTRPGRRPWAFYQFELGAVPRNAFEEIEVLDKAGLMTGEEALAVEAENMALNPRQSPEFTTRAHEQFHDRAMLRGMAREYRIAAGWHGRRGRAELRNKYLKLTQIVEEMETMSDERPQQRAS